MSGSKLLSLISQCTSGTHESLKNFFTCTYQGLFFCGAQSTPYIKLAYDSNKRKLGDAASSRIARKKLASNLNK